MRTAETNRRTAETDISLSLAIEGSGDGTISSGSGFFDHMLTLFAHHGRFDLWLTCEGDTRVDDHHTVEDIGICLGEAFDLALGDRRGITRYADITLPMDEALILCSVDISGRAGCYCELNIPTERVGDFDTELAKEFFNAFVRTARVTLHVRQLAGENSHHIIEGCFKAFGRVMAQASAIRPELTGEVPSTKGTLS